MKIEERLVRQSNEDRIAIGNIVKEAYNGKFGEVLRAYINGIITKESSYNQTNKYGIQPVPADRLLGRIEGYTNVLLDLERMIADAEQLERPLDKQEEPEEEFGPVM